MAEKVNTLMDPGHVSEHRRASVLKGSPTLIGFSGTGHRPQSPNAWRKKWGFLPGLKAALCAKTFPIKRSLKGGNPSQIDLILADVRHRRESPNETIGPTRRRITRHSAVPVIISAEYEKQGKTASRLSTVDRLGTRRFWAQTSFSKGKLFCLCLW
jgi:hypothetical protein